MAEPLLRIEGLNAYYAGAHVLEDVSFEMQDERPVAVIGRNGMGKTTLCAAIMNLTPPRATGSVKFRGEEVLGRPSASCRRGVVCSRHTAWTSTCASSAGETGVAAGRPIVSTSFSRVWPSGSETAERNSPGANSRCWRSHARYSSTRSS